MTIRYPLELSLDDLRRLADLVWASDHNRADGALLNYLEDVIQDAEMQEMEHNHERMFGQADNDRCDGE